MKTEDLSLLIAQKIKKKLKQSRDKKKHILTKPKDRFRRGKTSKIEEDKCVFELTS